MNTKANKAKSRRPPTAMERVRVLTTPPNGIVPIPLPGTPVGQGQAAFSSSLALALCDNDTKDVAWADKCKPYDRKEVTRGPVFIDNFCLRDESRNGDVSSSNVAIRFACKAVFGCATCVKAVQGKLGAHQVFKISLRDPQAKKSVGDFVSRSASLVMKLTKLKIVYNDVDYTRDISACLRDRQDFERLVNNKSYREAGVFLLRHAGRCLQRADQPVRGHIRRAGHRARRHQAR
jgi:hypothetical protein